MEIRFISPKNIGNTFWSRALNSNHILINFLKLYKRDAGDKMP